MGILDRLRNSLGNNNNTNDSTHKRYVPYDRDVPAMSPNSNKMNLAYVSQMLTEMSSNGQLVGGGAQGGFSQPVWGPAVNVLGDYSREGYTSQTFDQPAVAFVKLAQALEVDEDAQLAINHLSSMVTGGAHYWKAKTDEHGEYLSKYSKQLDFDWLDTIMIKELLWYGNSVWKPRMGISEIRNKDDLLWIPISSFKRVWWDRQRVPYVYEFRGAQYQGYHQINTYNADVSANDIIHLMWNPVDSSAFGIGLGVPIMAEREYQVQTTSGLDDRKSPSLMDQKLETRHNMIQTQKRYLSRNVYSIMEGEDEDVQALRSDLASLEPQEDVVSGNKIEVQELGSAQRSFDPTLFSDLVEGPIMKALNTFRGKQAGESQHTYANAESAAQLEEIGLASFPLTVARQIEDKLFRVWYDANPMYDPSYYGGMLALPWDEIQPELNFGRQEKKTVEPEMAVKLLEMAIQSGAMPDPVEIRDILGKLGLPVTQKYTDMLNAQYNNTGVMPPYFQTGDSMSGPIPPDWNTYQADNQTPRPMDYSQYTPDYDNPTPRYPIPDDGQPVIQAQPTAPITPGIDPQPSDATLNHDAITRINTEPKITYKKPVSKLSIGDVNAFLNDGY